MQSVRQYARQKGLNEFTVYRRMFAMFGNKPWEEYTIEEIRAVSKPARRPMKRKKTK